MNCEYVAEQYGVPACIGMRIDFRGREGVISEDRGNYIGVTFDDEKPGQVSNLHPTWKVKYLEMGTVRKVKLSGQRSKQRYQQYLDGEYSESFGEFLKYGWYRKEAN